MIPSDVHGHGRSATQMDRVKVQDSSGKHLVREVGGGPPSDVPTVAQEQMDLI